MIRRRIGLEAGAQAIADDPELAAGFRVRGAVYDSGEEFYREVADELRARSPELDYGVMWYDLDLGWPHYRVSLVLNSGEVIAVCLAGPLAGQVEILGTVAVTDARESCERLLAGWAELPSEHMALDWLRLRLS